MKAGVECFPLPTFNKSNNMEPDLDLGLDLGNFRIPEVSESML